MVTEDTKSFYHGKEVLVTGGAGFIGSHLVERLVDYGAHVTILDNFSTGSLKNVSTVINKVTFLYADVSNSYSTFKATHHKDLVFHLAAFVSVAQSVKDPVLCQKINVQGTRNILDGCIANNVKTLIYSSSSAVYGDQDGPCTEDSPTNPQSPYASSKADSEQLCKEYALGYHLNTACLRYFNVYGQRQNPQGEYAAVVAKFKYALQNNLPIVIFGDGTQTRDFIHVTEVVDANLTIGTQSNQQGNIFNVGTGKSISLLELIELLEGELQTKAVDITYQPARTGDITHSQANCEKIKKFITI